jgi:hypothetical protein
MNESFRGFPQSLQENGGTVPQSGYDHFLASYFQFITHLSSYHLTLHTDGPKVVRKDTLKYVRTFY